MGALPKQDTVDQMKKLRSLTKGSDVGDQIKDITNKYYNGTNGATIKNALDGYVDSWENYMKNQRKYLNKASKKLKMFEDFTNQLEMGIKVEKEHEDLYNYLKNYLKEKGIIMPLSLDQFAEKIAKDHLKELKDYYTRLMDMEKTADLYNNLKSNESIVEGKDIMITIPKNISWEDYEKELEAAANGEVMNFKVQHFPKTSKGNKCYIVHNGKVKGYMTISGLTEKSFTCSTTGKEWTGKFIERTGKFHKIEEYDMKGFQGFRYLN